MPKPLPSPEMLRKLLRYEPDTGKLFWRERTVDMFNGECEDIEWRCNNFNSRLANKEAFTSIDESGYRQGILLRKKFRAHRIIFAIFHGYWPSGQIDHINGNRSDNRISNLREVSHSDNARNQKLRCNNVSGAHGVSWHSQAKMWHARIKVDGKTKHLGLFSDLSEAVRARRCAEKEYGYHENHGKR